MAVTRARRHLTLVCDSTTVGAHAFIQSLVDHVHLVGDVVSAQEWVDQGLVTSGGGDGGGGSVASSRPKKNNDAHKKANSVEPLKKPQPKSAGVKRKEPNATVIAETLLESSSRNKGGEVEPAVGSGAVADPWSFLKLSIDSFIADQTENEFHFTETLSAKGQGSVFDYILPGI